MASKENRFSQSEGGAMLTPNDNAQSSFPKEQLQAEKAMQRQSVAQAQEEPETDDEGKDSDLEENKQDNLEKKVVKEGAEAALESAGVPPSAAKSVVKKADEKGIIDGIISKTKSKKFKIISKVLAVLAPIFIWVVNILLIIIVLICIIVPVYEKSEYLINLLKFDSGALAESLDEIGSDLFSGSIFFQTYLGVSIPNHGYVNLQVADVSGENQKKVQEEEIKRLSEINAAILAAPYYYDFEYSDSNAVTLSSLFTEWEGIDKIKQVTDFFNQGDIYRQTAEDACVLAFAGLSSNGQSYFQKVLGKTGELSQKDYKDAIDKINNNECKDAGGFANKFDITSVVKKIDFSNPDSIMDGINKIPASLYKDVIEGEGNPINQKLHDNIGDFRYDKETYKQFLEKYYVDEKYYDLLKDDNGNFTEEKKKTFVDGVISYAETVEDYAESSLKTHYENLAGSGNNEKTLIDTLGSVYGESKCSILEQYNPLTHEYITSKSIDSDEIYSVSDGEVIGVTYSEGNIYSKYDQKTKKCICDGVECKNSNGSEIKIKFEYDEVEYVAIYSNLAEIRVDVGDIVKKGDIIATEGNSGCTNNKKLTFKIISESGISYNTNELLQRCSSYSNTTSLCNFQNIEVNLYNCSGEFIKNIPFYDYIKEETYKNFKIGINNKEFLKAAGIIIATKTLYDVNYEVGMTEIDIKSCNYHEELISDTESIVIDNSISAVMGQIALYNGKFANVKYSNMCNRNENDKAANSIYNELCINEAIKLSDSKSYSEILKIYYPNFYISENYCSDYASKINAYSLDNNKKILTDTSYSVEEVLKINSSLKEKTELAKYGTRASVVEAARFLTLGLKYRIPYQNGGKYFELGFNVDWYKNGLDSSGFVSWALLNGGAKIDKGMTSKELISNNVVGSLKINSSLYKYYDKIQVGDFAYSDERIGLIIGKSDGILYVAEANQNSGLIVTKIASYGESDSNYTYIYFADNYYQGVGNLTSMW